MRTLIFSSNGGECCNPTLRECEDEIHTPEIGTSETSEFNYRGQNTCIGVFFISLESY